MPKEYVESKRQELASLTLVSRKGSIDPAGSRFRAYTHQKMNVGALVAIFNEAGNLLGWAHMVKDLGASGEFVKYDGMNKVTVNGGENWYEFEVLTDNPDDGIMFAGAGKVDT